MRCSKVSDSKTESTQCVEYFSVADSKEVVWVSWAIAGRVKKNRRENITDMSKFFMEK